MRISIIKYFILSVIILQACNNGTESFVPEERPHEPWVFRSVLDLTPRMVTLALNKDMWVAYSTENCALYQAWKGSVNFDGPVYTTHHGPQPLSIGDKYVVGKNFDPWFLKSGSSMTKANASYKGHRIVNNRAELMYELTGENLQTPIKVYEAVEYIKSESGMPTLTRKYTTENVPSNTEVVLKTNFNSVIVKKHLVTDGKIQFTSEKEVIKDEIHALELEADLILNSNTSTSLDVIFLQKPLIYNVNQMEEEVEDYSLPEGQRLIAKSDCKTCHNKNVKTIGPSYVSIANKYESTPDNIKLLTSKIKVGGSGIWGDQVMTPHPTLSNTAISKMSEYILSLRTVAVGTSAEDIVKDNNSYESADIPEAQLIPGLYTEIRKTQKNVSKISDYSYQSKPLFAGIMPNFDNLSGNDFQKVEDDFSIKAEGFIFIPKEGEYSFRVWSDDGSKLSLDGKTLLDNDGLHGTVYKDGKVSLSEGYYPLVLEYFNGSGGKFLSLNWKPAGSSDYEIIPFENLYHNSDKRKSLDGFTLPMASVSKIPGNKFPLTDVHPSFDLHQARPLTFTPKVGGIDFFSDGSMAVSTWDAAGSVYRLSNLKTDDPDDIVVTKIAQGLAEPLGLKIVDDEIYIMQKQELTRLIDNDGDGMIDEYRTICDGWKVSSNFHEFGFGLAYKDGYFYATLATAIEPGGASTSPQIKDRGKVIRISKETGALTFMASGLRTPNGIGWGYNGELFVADNQGDWLPSSKIVHITEGDWFGSRSVDPEESYNWTEKKPVVWLPQDEIGNSPSTPSVLNKGPYKNQMIHGEVTHGGVKRVFVEEVDGVLQGSLFRFTQGLEAGINRIVWSPDGDLYVGGIGSTGNWGHSGKLQYGLQRLSYNDKSTFEMLAVRAKSDGLEIEFTESLKPGEGWDKSIYDISQFYYKPTEEYGGPKLGNTALPIRSVNVSSDRKKVFLELGGMKPDHVIYIHLEKPMTSEKGQQIWTTESWYTMNKIPRNKPGFKTKTPRIPGDNELSEAEKLDNWKLLFDGKTTDGWRTFRKDKIGSSWKAKNGVLFLDSEKKDSGGWQAADGGDIITLEEYENYEFSIDWKISNCGNSGIIYNVVESDKYDHAWLTGPEMQILDNSCHPDTKYPTHRAGDLYDMIETKFITVNPAGNWNTSKIKTVDGKVEFWLNGYKVVDFTMHNEEWKNRIANSKFKDMPDFGLAKKGHIALQDHGDPVSFKNIKIKRL